MTTQADILEQLQAWFLERTGEDFDTESRYLESDKFDSFDVIDLVAHIESTYDIQLQAADFQSLDFNSLAGLSRLIAARVDRG